MTAKPIVLYKPGTISSKQAEKLSKAGYLPLEVTEFDAIKFADPDQERAFKFAAYERCAQIIKGTSWDTARTQLGAWVLNQVLKP